MASVCTATQEMLRCDVRFLDDLAYIVREYGHHPAIWREALRLLLPLPGFCSLLRLQGPKKLPLFWLYDACSSGTPKRPSAEPPDVLKKSTAWCFFVFVG